MSEGVETLQRSLEVLLRRFPAAGRRLEEAPPLPEGALREGRGGDPTLCLRGEDGREVFLHSRYDPRGEARDQVTAAGVLPGDTVVLLGVGLGYGLEALLADARPGLVIAAERSLEVLR